MIAIRENRSTISCIEYDLTEEEALRVILDRYRETNSLSPYCRVLLALRLELELQESARRRKAREGTPLSSNLTKQERTDVRKEIARISGVSTGNVTKVKQILESAAPEVRLALQRGIVRIHRAWKWRGFSAQRQQEALLFYTSGKSVQKVVSRLIRQHVKSEEPDLPTIKTLAQLLNRFTGGVLGPPKNKVTSSRLIIPIQPDCFSSYCDVVIQQQSGFDDC